MTYSILKVIPDQYIIIGTDGRNDDRGVAPGFIREISLKPGEIGKTIFTTTFNPPHSIDAYFNNTYIGYQITDAVELPMWFQNKTLCTLGNAYQATNGATT